MDESAGARCGVNAGANAGGKAFGERCPGIPLDDKTLNFRLTVDKSFEIEL